METLWCKLEPEAVFEKLQCCGDGLTQEEAAKRLAEFGPNSLEEKKKKTPFMMLLDQFKDFMILILLGAAVIAGAIGELVDTLVIVVIVVANAVIGFIQEYRAEKAMEALKDMAAASAVALRDCVPTRVPSSRLVPGDVVILEAGNIVPADMRIVEAAQLRIEEAALTGESIPVEKEAKAIEGEDASLGDRINMVYKGTTVTFGRGRGVVVATGMKTELGKIATMLQDEEEVRTPLQKRLAAFSRKLAVAVLAICAIVFGIGIVRGEPALLMLLTAISLAVAAIPEALPAVITISLALGAKKMVKTNALVRKLPAVETLGSVTYVCSDKTGTLTLNRMTVEEIWAGGRRWSAGEEGVRGLADLMKGLALSNDAQEGVDGLIGDPTETALYAAAKAQGFQKEALEERHGRVAEIPFDSDRKCMTTIHRWGEEGFVAYTKGAVDVLLRRAVRQWTEAGEGPVDAAQILAANDEMASRGLRVLCFARREWNAPPAEVISDTVEAGLTILGLVGMMDPPRDEAREAVALCKTAGIIPVMITGDHPVTARAIAERVGILDGDGTGRVLTGQELGRLSLEEFEKTVESVRVYARVAPEQKLKIVKALQDRGQFVAMTGDGVNDAPALKRADIGVAMGITGTDVSKEAAHMILLDDNFATIVNAVREGRKIYDNIRKFIKYLLTTNSGEIWTLFLAQVIGLPVPLLPIHILWVNLVSDGLPALALSVEPGEADLMKKPPRNPRESIFAHGLGIHVIWVGLFMAATVLGTQAWALGVSDPSWQTMVFTVLCLTQLGHVLAIRSETRSLFSQGITTNKALLGAVVISFALQMATIYVPFMNVLFRTQPLSAGQLALCIAVSSLVFFAVEVEKWIKRGRAKR
jgi:Ca2+-transporting ATPase